MRKRARILIVTLAVLLALAAGVLWLFEDQILFHRKFYRPEIVEHVEQEGGHRIEVTTSQGAQVAFFRPARTGDATRPEFLWFIFPSRASRALDFWGHTGRWDRRFAYVFVDYPG